MANPPKTYRIGDVLVEAVKSEGGRLYDIKIIATGEKFRCLASIFEKIAKPYRENK